jgi:uncharacterized repeat protein (TIGR01451 family)
VRIRSFSTTTTLLALITFFSAGLSADPIVSLQPAGTTVPVGRIFDIDVSVSDIQGLFAFQFDIRFDPAILSAQVVREGPFLEQSGLSTAFVPGKIDNTAGVIELTADTLLGGPSGVDGNGVLASVAFLTRSKGSSDVSTLNVVLLDSQLSSISFEQQDALVTVAEPNTAVLLLGVGLMLVVLAYARQYAASQREAEACANRPRTFEPPTNRAEGRYAGPAILCFAPLARTLIVAALSTACCSAMARSVHETFTVNGKAHTCVRFQYKVNILGRVFTIEPKESLGWVRVNQSDPLALIGRSDVDLSTLKYRSVTGIVTRSEVSFEDFPDVHDSHDFNIDIRLDDVLPDFADIPILSANQKPGTIEVEWETGILVNDFTGDGLARFYPKWAWPSVGDRIWANGEWIFDCGHPDDQTGLHTELHPLRAVALMRQQVATPPDSTVPIPVTATDLYIHGRAGIATDVVECENGQFIVLGNPCKLPSGDVHFVPKGRDPRNGNTAQERLGHDPVSEHVGTPINLDFEFDICTPARPSTDAILKVWFLNGPEERNERTRQDPILTIVSVGHPSLDPCSEFSPFKVHARIPLAESGISPSDVYSRTIYAGWMRRNVVPQSLRHFRVHVDAMHLIVDKDEELVGEINNDCECTFFWVNVDRAPNEWLRLSDFATKDMDKFRAGQTVTFTPDALFDFFVRDGQPFIIRANGYDGGFSEPQFVNVGPSPQYVPRDCIDQHMGHHDLRAHIEFSTIFPVIPPFTGLPIDPCYDAIFMEANEKNGDYSGANNDPFQRLVRAFPAFNNYGLGSASQVQFRLPSGTPDPKAEYELLVTLEEVPISRSELEVSVDAPRSVFPGNTLRYAVTVTNVGVESVEGVTLMDTLPSNVSFDGTSGAIACFRQEGPNQHVLLCPVRQTLLPGQSAQIQIVASSAPDAAGTIAANKAVAISAGSASNAKTTGTAIGNADLDGDGLATCADLLLVKKSLGTRLGQDGYVGPYDINGDGVIDVRDLAFVGWVLGPGSRC